MGRSSRFPQVGAGSVYEVATTDGEGKPLDGGKAYSVTLPGPIPARHFWSFMVYDNHTRAILETDQKAGGLDGNAKGLKVDQDGTTTVYFGPEAPKGHEKKLGTNHSQQRLQRCTTYLRSWRGLVW